MKPDNTEELSKQLDQVFAYWESEVTGAPIHWKKSDERKEIDAGYKDQIMQLIEAELTEANAKHDEIYKWLLGESGDFPLSEPGKRYNWRTELRRRLAELNKGKEGNHE